VSGDPSSPATVENRSSVRVVVPGANTAACVQRLTSAVTVKVPYAPDPLACGRRSGTFMRLKWASVSTRCTSWSISGPTGPMLRELRSLSAIRPPAVYEPE